MLFTFVVSALAVASTLSGTVRIDGAKGEDASGVVVFVSGYSEEAGDMSAKIVQTEQHFVPLLTPITQGGKIVFENKDSRSHNVFSTSGIRPFDLGSQEPGAIHEVLFSKNGVVDIFCNIHPDMAASILVLPNKAFAITDKEGKYSIHGIRKGKFKVAAYHFLAKSKAEELEFGDQNATKDFVLVLRKQEEHLNKFGQPYKKGKAKY